MKYKAIRSAAHNFGHSFMSTLNYVGNDYVMSHIAWAVADSGKAELRINFLDGTAEPAELTPPPVLESIALRKTWLPKHLVGHGIEPTAIRAAQMTFRFDLSQRTEILSEHHVGAWRMPVECRVEMLDDRGKLHVAVLQDSCIAESRRSMFFRRLFRS
jgi:hypothetical protein